MTLNRSPEFKSSNPKTQSSRAFLVSVATISANAEELNSYAIHYTKFQASEPSGSETRFFSYCLSISMFQTQEPIA